MSPSPGSDTLKRVFNFNLPGVDIMRSIRMSLARVAGLMVFFAAFAHAQFETATVLGTVLDSSKLPIGGSVVTLTNIETGVSQTTSTNEYGDYQFVNVRIGRY